MSEPAMLLQFFADTVEENGSKGFSTTDGMTLFAVKKNGQLNIYKNSCPHLGIELEWQPDQFLDSEGTLIQCSTHGALFIIESGECVAGPCMGKALQALPFTEENGTITVFDC